jgi:tRNA 5-methylaminomethyl-2-thiouridine biosynthesis bifunctional protein
MTEDRSPRLEWAEDGTPRSARFGDVYFSREDGLAESRAVFLAGCGLPEAWAGRPRFTVGELGFGTGLNIAALLDLWRRTRPAGGRLQVFSVEGFPIDRDEAVRALSAWPELAEVATALTSVWPAPTPGFHRLDLPAFDCTIDLGIGDAAEMLAQWSGKADAWFLDGFAPSTNPGMWSDAVLDGVAARSAPGARLATFTVAGAVRRGLADRGFVVEKRPGHGRKRERLEARRGGPPAGARRPSVAIVGAGIAGAALTRAFRHLGLEPLVIEADAPGAGGSGFPVGLVTPRLDAGDRDIAALYAQALERAGDLYARTPDAIASRGVLQLEQTPRDARRHATIAAQDIWTPEAMSLLDAPACRDRLGEAVDAGGLWMRDALAVRPRRILDAWLADVRLLRSTVAGAVRTPTGWRLQDAAGDALAEADVVVLAAGWGAAALAPGLSLAPVAGQTDWIEQDPTLAAAVAWGGYAAPAGPGLLFGATHVRGETAPRVSEEASAANLATLAARLPRLAARVAAAGPSQARTAVRATTPDRLPVAGALDEGLFVLGGLGSRGLCAAPLLAEHVAARAVDESSPLPANLAWRVDPARFNGPCAAREKGTGCPGRNTGS